MDKNQQEFKKAILSFRFDTSRPLLSHPSHLFASNHLLGLLSVNSLQSSFSPDQAMLSKIITEVSGTDQQGSFLALKLLNKVQCKNLGQFIADNSKQLSRVLNNSELFFEKMILLTEIIVKAYSQQQVRGGQVSLVLQNFLIKILTLSLTDKPQKARAFYEVFRTLLLKLLKADFPILKQRLLLELGPKNQELFDKLLCYQLRTQCHLMAVPVMLLIVRQAHWSCNPQANLQLAYKMINYFLQVQKNCFQFDIFMETSLYVLRLMVKFQQRMKLHWLAISLSQIFGKAKQLMRRGYRRQFDQFIWLYLDVVQKCSFNEGVQSIMKIIENIFCNVQNRYTRTLLLTKSCLKLFMISNCLVQAKKHSNLVLVLFEQAWFISVLLKKPQLDKSQDVITSQSKCEMANALLLGFLLAFDRFKDKHKEKLNLFNQLKELLDLFLRTINWRKLRSPIERASFKLYVYLLSLTIKWTSPQQIFLHLNQVTEFIKMRENDWAYKVIWVNQMLQSCSEVQLHLNWQDLIQDIGSQLMLIVRQIKDVQLDAMVIAKIEEAFECIWRIFQVYGRVDHQIKSAVMNLFVGLIPQLQRSRVDPQLLRIQQCCQDVLTSLQTGEPFTRLLKMSLQSVNEYKQSIEFQILRVVQQINNKTHERLNLDIGIRGVLDLPLKAHDFPVINVMPIMSPFLMTVRVHRVQLPYISLACLVESKCLKQPLRCQILHKENCQVRKKQMTMECGKWSEVSLQIKAEEDIEICFELWCKKVFVGRGVYCISLADLFIKCQLGSLHNFIKKTLINQEICQKSRMGEGMWLSSYCWLVENKLQEGGMRSKSNGDVRQLIKR